MIYKGVLKMLMYFVYTLPCMDAQMPWAQDAQERPLFRPFPPRLEAPTSGALGTLRFALPLIEIVNSFLDLRPTQALDFNTRSRPP